MPEMDLRPNEVEQSDEEWRLSWIRHNTEVRRQLCERYGDPIPKWLEDQEWLLTVIAKREEENRRLRQIIADVRRLVETMEPDNVGVQG